MRRFIAILGFAVLVPLVSPASEFDWFVREFSRQTSAKPIHIPLFGVARFAVAVAHPAGATQLHLAVFENVELKSDDFTRVTDNLIGSSWRPVVRVRSRNGDATNIYARSNGKDKEIHFLLTTLDSGDATFVELRVGPEALLKFVDEHRR